MMEKKENEGEIRKAVQERVQAEVASTTDSNGHKINSNFVNQCIFENEAGDGALFVAIHRGHFIFDAAGETWYYWAGHHWERDDLGYAYSAVKEVAEVYLQESNNLRNEIKKAKSEDKTDRANRIEAQRQRLQARFQRLNSKRGSSNCLYWARALSDSLRIHGEDFDRDPMLLACANGVLELRSGRFRPGRPDDYLVKAVPHEWAGIETPAPAWEAFLSEIFQDDGELIDYLRRLFGYGITGLVSEHIIPVLHGVGRNGKGTLIETIRYVLGPLAQPIPSEMLLEQRFGRSSTAPSPDLMSLKGLRIAFASETDEGSRFSSSRAKWLSGGDLITARNPHDKHTSTFAPTHLLCLLTNHLPRAAGDDFAFWQRIHLVPFKIKFVDKPAGELERPRDKDLPARLRAEAPGILAWLVRGCLEWQRDGLNPPQVVLRATEAYRFSEDTIAEFVEDCCSPPSETAPDAREKFADVYGAFEVWFIKTCGDHPPKKKKFSTLMEKKFRKAKVGGTVYFYGLSLLPTWDREE